MDHLNFMATATDVTVIPDHYPVNIDPTRCPVAFGRGAIVYLLRDLGDDRPITRCRAIRALCDHLMNPLNIPLAIKCDVVSALKTCLADHESHVVREKAAEAFKILATSEVGRKAILKGKVIKDIGQLFNDPYEVARFKSHQAIEMIARSRKGALAVVSNGFISYLLFKLLSNPEKSTKPVILDTLHSCLVLSPDEGRHNEGFPIIMELMNDKVPQNQEKALQALADLVISFPGKDVSIFYRLIPKILTELENQSPEWKTAAANVICMISIKPEGRYEILKIPNGMTKIYVLLYEWGNTSVQLSAIKILTNLAECPECHSEILSRMNRFMKHYPNITSPALQRHIRTLMRVLNERNYSE